jgi:hypothetical protein
MFATLPRWSRVLGRAIVIVIMGTILADRLGPATWSFLPPVTTQIYTWVLLLGAFSLLLGVAHVTWIHLRRIQRGQAEWPLSLALVAGLVTVVILGVASPQGTASPMISFVFASVIAPGQATLFALLAFFMAGAAYRLLRINRPGGGWMLLGALLIILAQIPLTGRETLAALHPVADWLVTTPVMAVLRGVLLGTGVGAVIAGIGATVGSEG